MKETRLPDDHRDLADATVVENLTGCRGEQPCNLGWPANDIRPVANSAFLDENTAVRALLENVHIPIGDIFSQNAQMNQGADSTEDLTTQAAAWLDNRQQTVEEWHNQDCDETGQ